MVEDARSARQGPRWGAWLEQHVYAALSSLGRMWQNRLGSALTVVVAGLSLALPLFLYLLDQNLRLLADGAEPVQHVRVFLQPGLSAETTTALARSARQLPDVARVAVRTPAQGLQELERLPGFAAALAELGDNPLPYMLEITPAPPGANVPPRLLQTLADWPETAWVQHDDAWHRRIRHALELLDRLRWGLMALLGLGLLCVVGNSIRLDIERCADQIGVMRLFGGSRRLIQRPFLYAGFWYGLAVGALAYGTCWLLQSWLETPALELLASYGDPHDPRRLDGRMLLATLAAATALGWSGAWVTVQYQLAKSARAQ